MTTTATSLFFGAIGDVLRDWSTTLRIVCVPVLLYSACELFFLSLEIPPLSDANIPPVIWPSFARFFLYALMIGSIAVSWHRFKLRDEPPSQLAPRLNPKLWARYAVAWFVVGFVITLGLLVVVGLPLYVALGLAFPEMGERVMYLLGSVQLADLANDPLAAGICFAAATLTVWVGLYWAFRATLGLPALAISDGVGYDMTTSWQRSAPLRGVLAVTALWATVGQMAITFAPEPFLYSDPGWMDADVPLSYAYAVKDAVILLVFGTINALIGAAILTRIYAALPLDLVPDSAPDDASDDTEA